MEVILPLVLLLAPPPLTIPALFTLACVVCVLVDNGGGTRRLALATFPC